MAALVTVRTVRPRILAAVRREVRPDEVGSAWGPAIDPADTETTVVHLLR